MQFWRVWLLLLGTTAWPSHAFPTIAKSNIGSRLPASQTPPKPHYLQYPDQPEYDPPLLTKRNNRQTTTENPSATPKKPAIPNSPPDTPDRPPDTPNRPLINNVLSNPNNEPILKAYTWMHGLPPRIPSFHSTADTPDLSTLCILYELRVSYPNEFKGAIIQTHLLARYEKLAAPGSSRYLLAASLMHRLGLVVPAHDPAAPPTWNRYAFNPISIDGRDPRAGRIMEWRPIAFVADVAKYESIMATAPVPALEAGPGPVEVTADWLRGARNLLNQQRVLSAVPVPVVENMNSLVRLPQRFD
ncbi:MAG: hypothetical protein M1829_005699 [Trizodia sp. TS-e1964]|nr:MAG: hypothetical protein M1829_005699 [Trizodia sp. TS-e1964]